MLIPYTYIRMTLDGVHDQVSEPRTPQTPLLSSPISPFEQLVTPAPPTLVAGRSARGDMKVYSRQ
jgi:hypothetical protein